MQAVDQAAAFLQRASAKYHESGHPDTAGQVLVKAAKWVGREGGLFWLLEWWSNSLSLSLSLSPSPQTDGGIKPISECRVLLSNGRDPWDWREVQRLGKGCSLCSQHVLKSEGVSDVWWCVGVSNNYYCMYVNTIHDCINGKVDWYNIELISVALQCCSMLVIYKDWAFSLFP